MSEFKDGDLVTILTSNSAPKDTVGKIGKVISHEFGSYLVDVPDTAHENKKWYYSENQLGFPTNKPKVDLKDLIKADLDKPKSASGELVVNEQGGIKFDQGKVDYTYLLKDLPVSVEEVTKVLIYGANKYSRSNYSKVESERYEAAFLRHSMSYLQGEQLDPETGYHHLAHAVCCLMFLIEREVKKENK